MKRCLALLMVAHIAALADNLVVHEWGTFTSLMGSDGKRQEGMHQEEEALPDFVYGFSHPQNEAAIKMAGRCGHVKLPCATLHNLAQDKQPSDIMPKNPLGAGITQKMETPVIYFYGDVGQRVQVTVDFPQGIISQYYPRAASYAPSYNEISSLGPSTFSFDVELLAPDNINDLPKTTANSIWNPSRVVKANTIRAQDEHEKFIFYRGVGDFDAGIVVTNDGRRVTINNQSPQTISRAFILNFDGSKGVINDIGAIASQKSVAIPKTSLSESDYIAQAKNLIVSALVQEGLFLDEAQGLVNTWEKSYFKTQGTRILYLVPRSETDRIIPLKVNPAPSKLVRVLVGRIEVMSKTEEDLLAQKIVRNPSLDMRKELGHYAEPKLRRVLSILHHGKAKNVGPAITAIHRMLGKTN